jgi:Lrp/AsnC family leucine-responsive transcriptional regulator
MDNLDTKIIKLLQSNARVTASEIASEINLSVPAVSERLKKLENSGVIMQYTAIVDPEHFNKTLMALVFVTLERPQFSEIFAEFVMEQNDILECHYLAGDYDYALKVVTENTGTLQELLNRIKSIHGVQDTRTIVILSTAKNNYSVIPEESEPQDRMDSGSKRRTR